jgi:cyclic lactone autoinducer peptide
MWRNLKTFLLSSSACIISLIAFGGVSTRCMLFLYEPDIPESLKRDL